MLLLRYVFFFTCIIIPVKANEKGQYVSWLRNTTIVRQIMISGFFNLRAI